MLATSDISRWAVLGTFRMQGHEVPGNGPFYRTLSFPGHRHKVRLLCMPTKDSRVIAIGSSLQGTDIILERYRETFGTALVVMIVCGGLFGFLLARKAMSGVQRVTDTATQIGRHGLGRRVPPAREGEVFRDP